MDLLASDPALLATLRTGSDEELQELLRRAHTEATKYR